MHCQRMPSTFKTGIALSLSVFTKEKTPRPLRRLYKNKRMCGKGIVQILELKTKGNDHFYSLASVTEQRIRMTNSSTSVFT